VSRRVVGISGVAHDAGLEVIFGSGWTLDFPFPPSPLWSLRLDPFSLAEWRQAPTRTLKACGWRDWYVPPPRFCLLFIRLLLLAMRDLKEQKDAATYDTTRLVHAVALPAHGYVITVLCSR